MFISQVGFSFEFILARSAPSRLIVSQQRNKTCQSEQYCSVGELGEDVSLAWIIQSGINRWQVDSKRV